MKTTACPEEFERSLPPRKRFKLLQEKQRLEEERQVGKFKDSNAAPPKAATHLKRRLLKKEEEEEGASPLAELAAKKSGITSRISAPCKEATQAQLVEEEGEDDDGVSCDVCRSGDADPSDPIVFCDGCDVAVHTSCYGYPLSLVVPDGNWYCARCREGGVASGSCCLCPSTTGAMKRTTDGRWAHITCAIYVPEVFFVCGEGREPVDCSRVPSKRREMVCSVCGGTDGACVQCTETGCGETFHVACGFDRELSFEYLPSAKGAVVLAFCEKHTPVWEQVKGLPITFIAAIARYVLHIFGIDKLPPLPVTSQQQEFKQRKSFRIVPREVAEPVRNKTLR